MSKLWDKVKTHKIVSIIMVVVLVVGLTAGIGKIWEGGVKTPSFVAQAADGNTYTQKDFATDIITRALSYLGYSYESNTSPAGYDCTGFIRKILMDEGFYPPVLSTDNSTCQSYANGNSTTFSNAWKNWYSSKKWYDFFNVNFHQLPVCRGGCCNIGYE